MPIAASELILNERGAIYHLNLRPEEIASLIITVGDPARVKEISKYFDKLEYSLSHREFITHTGYIGKQRLSVISTGIGTDNIEIVFTELDALVNIDLSTREIKKELNKLQIIRLGTCGSLQEDIPDDGLIISTAAIGLDNLLRFYARENTVEENELLTAFRSYMDWKETDIFCYSANAAIDLHEKFSTGFYKGITLTCPGFYAPQGRRIRTSLSYPNFMERLPGFQFQSQRICNFEMETSAMYALGKLLGHDCLSISTAVNNRVRKTFSKDIKKSVTNMIKKSLERII